MSETQSANSENTRLVPAIFENRDQASMAVAKLREMGFAEGDIGVAALVDTRAHGEQADREVAAAAGKGAATGATLGSIGGMGLAALGAGEALAIGGGLLLAVGTGGLLWGGVIGGLIGVITRVRRQPDRDQWCELALDDDDVLLVARLRDWTREDEVAAALTAAGAKRVLDELPQDRSWRELEVEHPSGQTIPRAATS
jgi:hypothetical protein